MIAVSIMRLRSTTRDCCNLIVKSQIPASCHKKYSSFSRPFLSKRRGGSRDYPALYIYIYILLGSTKETIDATVACKVLSENISTIIKSQINFPSLAKEVISDVDKRKIMDSKTTLSIDERWRELLDLVQATIELDEEVFLIIISRCN